MHCPRDMHNHGTELAMKVVRQARLELSGGSTPDLLRPRDTCESRQHSQLIWFALQCGKAKQCTVLCDHDHIPVSQGCMRV